MEFIVGAGLFYYFGSKFLQAAVDKQQSQAKYSTYNNTDGAIRDDLAEARQDRLFDPDTIHKDTKMFGIKLGDEQFVHGIRTELEHREFDPLVRFDVPPRPSYSTRGYTVNF
jgi:hypothetical protein